MNERTVGETHVFRASKHMLAGMGILSGLLIALSFGGVYRWGDWEGVQLTVTASLVVFGLTLLLRLEVGPHGIRYRDLKGSRSLEFASLTRAYIEMLRNRRGRPSLATFCMESREGRYVR